MRPKAGALRYKRRIGTSVAVQKSANAIPVSPSRGLLNLSHTRINELLVSFESEVRIGGCREGAPPSESGH